MKLHSGGSAVNILGVKVTAYDSREALLDIILQRTEQGRPVKLAFANANLIYCSHKRPELREALAGFLVVNDGLGVNIASWLLTRRRFPSNLNGTDFTPYMLSHLPPRKLFLFGATASVVAKASAVILEKYPQHQIVGYENGYISQLAADELGEHVAESGADIILVALGNPRQELWLSKHFASTRCQLAAAVGAYFDFASGQVARAPGALRTLSLEWLFRLLLEPKRLFRRYSLEAVSFLVLVVRQRLRSESL